MNRNLWGVENFEQITIRHSKLAAQRFAHEVAPALTNFAELNRIRGSRDESRTSRADSTHCCCIQR